MALIKCHECGSEVSTEAKTCPKCGATPKTKSNMLAAVGSVVIAGAAIWFFYGGGVEQQAASDMARIEKQVAADAVDRYEVAKKSGNPMDICGQAGLVSGAYLQAKDEANYKKWQKTEQHDCAAAALLSQ